MSPLEAFKLQSPLSPQGLQKINMSAPRVSQTQIVKEYFHIALNIISNTFVMEFLWVDLVSFERCTIPSALQMCLGEFDLQMQGVVKGLHK